MSDTADPYPSLPPLLFHPSTRFLPLFVFLLGFGDGPGGFVPALSLLPVELMGSRSFEDLNLDGGMGVKNEDSVDRGCVPGLGLDPEQIAREED